MLKNHKECIETYGSNFALAKEVATGRLFRVDRGMYSDQKAIYENIRNGWMFAEVC